MALNFLHFLKLVLRAWTRKILTCQAADMRPELYKWLINLFDICYLLLTWLTLPSLDLVVVYLEFKLVLDVNPEHSKEILWVLFFILVAILVKVSILHESLASMDFGFIILTVHENSKETLCGLKAKDPCEIALGVIYCSVLLVTVYLVNRVVSINDLRDRHAEIPDHLGGTVFLGLELSDNHLDYLLDSLSNFFRLQDLFAFAFLLIIIKSDKVLCNEPKGSDGASCYFLLVASEVLSVLYAGWDEDIQGQRVILDDVFDWVQAADERNGPWVSDLYIDIRVSQDFFVEAVPYDFWAHVGVFCEKVWAFFMLNQIPVGLDSRCFQDWGDHNLILWILVLDFKYLRNKV